MKVTAYGMTLRAGNIHVTLDQLFEQLRLKSGTPQMLYGAERITYIDTSSDEEFVRGLIVTVKDQTKFCELIKASGGELTIKVNNLDEQNKVMEFNFFLINKKNGLGIYQHYYHSCALVTFQRHLRRVYREMSNASRDARLKAYGDNITSRIEKQIRAQHREGLSAATLFRKETLEQYLNGYKKIKGFSYEVASLHVNERTAEPLSGLVSRKREHLFFEPNIGKAKIVHAITGMLPQLKKGSAKVSVMDDDDETQSVRLNDIPDKYDIQEYDEIAAGIHSLNVSEFYRHPLLVGLRKVCTHTHKSVFMAKLKEKD